VSALPQATDESRSSPTAVRAQALFRALNEEIVRISDRFAVDDELALVCECELGDCFARLSVPADDYEAVRTVPNRFLIKPEHLSADERIVRETDGYAVVEKVGGRR
jgi:hypothetical protein